MSSDNICSFCFNAHVWAKLQKTDEDYFDNGLDDSNDFSSSTIGTISQAPNISSVQLYLNSGYGEATNLEVCEWFNGRWHTVAKYYPKYCPECGRKLDEYVIGERGRSFEKAAT
jgi:hypothetical protein